MFTFEVQKYLQTRDFTVISNNLVRRASKLRAIDVTAKAISERLYLVSGLVPICASCQLSLCTYNSTAQSPDFGFGLPRLFLDFCPIVLTRFAITWPSPVGPSQSPRPVLPSLELISKYENPTKDCSLLKSPNKISILMFLTPLAEVTP